MTHTHIWYAIGVTWVLLAMTLAGGCGATWAQFDPNNPANAARIAAGLEAAQCVETAVQKIKATSAADTGAPPEPEAK